MPNIADVNEYFMQKLVIFLLSTYYVKKIKKRTCDECGVGVTDPLQTLQVVGCINVNNTLHRYQLSSEH
jgi:hypothetical protein